TRATDGAASATTPTLLGSRDSLAATAENAVTVFRVLVRIDVVGGRTAADPFQRHKLLRTPDRQGAQQERVGHAEDGGTSPDADRENERGNGREAGISA